MRVLPCGARSRPLMISRVDSGEARSVVVVTVPSSTKRSNLSRLKSCNTEYAPVKEAAGIERARHGVSTMYRGSNPARARSDQARTIRRHSHNALWLSNSSEGKSWVSRMGERPASETSEGIGGTKGTCGNKNAQKERPRGSGRRLYPFRQYGVIALSARVNVLLPDKPFSCSVNLTITRS